MPEITIAAVLAQFFLLSKSFPTKKYSNAIARKTNPDKIISPLDRDPVNSGGTYPVFPAKIKTKLTRKYINAPSKYNTAIKIRGAESFLSFIKP